MAQSEVINDTPSIALPTEVAYAAILPEIQALPDDRAAAVNVDVVGTVTSVLGMLPELRAMRLPVCSVTDHAFALKLTTPAIWGGLVRSVATRVPN